MILKIHLLWQQGLWRRPAFIFCLMSVSCAIFHTTSLIHVQCLTLSWRIRTTSQKHLHALCLRVFGKEERTQWQTKLLEEVVLEAANSLIMHPRGSECDITSLVLQGNPKATPRKSSRPLPLTEAPTRLQRCDCRDLKGFTHSDRNQ